MFLGLDREARLSSASLETLAIVAYQQPVTRAEIEKIRGVDSSGVLAKLHARALVEPVARLATVGNPIQYGTTADFLNHFGLRSLADLPPLGEIGGKDGRALLDTAMTIEEEPSGVSGEVSNTEQHGDPT
jgi:segregation and condensation protein B